MLWVFFFNSMFAASSGFSSKVSELAEEHSSVRQYSYQTHLMAIIPLMCTLQYVHSKGADIHTWPASQPISFGLGLVQFSNEKQNKIEYWEEEILDVVVNKCDQKSAYCSWTLTFSNKFILLLSLALVYKCKKNHSVPVTLHYYMKFWEHYNLEI